MAAIEERLDAIHGIIQTEEFMTHKGLGNEIGFYIFDYDPEDEMLVRAHIQALKSRLNTPSSNRRVIEFDLYSIFLKILDDERLLTELGPLEEEYGSDYLLEAVRDIASPEVYVQYIESEVEDYDLVFLTGVGRVWPIVRSHTVLNNLHHVLDKTPVIMFFPGRYDGTELRLFGRIKDDNYYRAFSLVPR
jgi:hypothetical protein